MFGLLGNNSSKSLLLFPTDVAFNAQIEGNVPFNAGEKILFTKVLSNVGNGYDSTARIFTVPHNGTYKFTIMSMITSGIHYVFITVNGERLSVAYGDSSFGTGEERKYLFVSKSIFSNYLLWSSTIPLL